MPDDTPCRLQDWDLDGDPMAMWATVREDGQEHLVLTTHEADEEDGTPGYQTLGGHVELTAEGWQTLVEMWALRRPEALQRLVAKVARLQEMRHG